MAEDFVFCNGQKAIMLVASIVAYRCVLVLLSNLGSRPSLMTPTPQQQILMVSDMLSRHEAAQIFHAEESTEDAKKSA